MELSDKGDVRIVYGGTATNEEKPFVVGYCPRTIDLGESVGRGSAQSDSIVCTGIAKLFRSQSGQRRLYLEWKGLQCCASIIKHVEFASQLP